MMCPKCGSTNTVRERCMGGRSGCQICGFTESNIRWDELFDKLNPEDWQWKLITDTDAMYNDCVQKPILGSSVFIYRRKPKEEFQDKVDELMGKCKVLKSAHSIPLYTCQVIFDAIVIEACFRIVAREMHPDGQSLDKSQREATRWAVQNTWRFYNDQEAFMKFAKFTFQFKE